MHRRPFVTWTVATVMLAGTLHAEPRALDDATVTRRLSRVTHELELEEPSAARWSRNWIFTFAALTAIQAAGTVWAPDPGMRIDAKVGTVKSSLALLIMLVKPFPPASAASRLRELPEDTPAERREKLRVAEELLESSAKAEEFGQSWIPRVAANVANLAGAYYLWIEEKRFASGWLSLFAGMGVAELQIRTQPTGAIGAWHAYRAHPDAARGAPSLVPQLSLGLGLAPTPLLLVRGAF